MHHIRRHDVTVLEAEDACFGSPLFRQSYDGRILAIGPTRTARMVAVALDPEGGGVFYPVTARPASRKERRRYEANRQGG